MSEEALQISVKRREAKGKGYNEIYTILNAGFQRITRRYKKAFLSDQCNEIEENNRIGKAIEKDNRKEIEIYSRKFEIPREHFMQRWAQ